MASFRTLVFAGALLLGFQACFSCAENASNQSVSACKRVLADVVVLQLEFDLTASNESTTNADSSETYYAYDGEVDEGLSETDETGAVRPNSTRTSPEEKLSNAQRERLEGLALTFGECVREKTDERQRAFERLSSRGASANAMSDWDEKHLRIEEEVLDVDWQLEPLKLRFPNFLRAIERYLNDFQERGDELESLANDLEDRSTEGVSRGRAPVTTPRQDKYQHNRARSFSWDSIAAGLAVLLVAAIAFVCVSALVAVLRQKWQREEVARRGRDAQENRGQLNAVGVHIETPLIAPASPGKAVPAAASRSEHLDFELRAPLVDAIP